MRHDMINIDLEKTCWFEMLRVQQTKKKDKQKQTGLPELIFQVWSKIKRRTQRQNRGENILIYGE